MFEEWVEFERFPGTRVLMEPMDYVISFRVDNARTAKRRDNPGFIVDGEIIRDVIGYVVKDWVHAPLQRGKYSEKFDRDQIRWLQFEFATALYLKAAEMAQTTEEETKNSESQST